MKGEQLVRWLVIGAMFAQGLPAPALAAEANAAAKKDPNEIVCEREPMLGSRLQVRKTCMTRAQWAERRQLDRSTVERSQTQLCGTIGGRCMAGD